MRERLVLAGLVALAAATRLPGLASRGRFDADQGHDMLTLMAFTREGVWPLLGPKTSVGDFHHGAFYYYLLAPAAAISNNDPVIVTAWIALLGIGAVVLTWWLARSIGGPLAGALAGLLLALSPAAIDESTFIWNPNPIAFFAVLSLAAAWHAHVGASPGHDPGAERMSRGRIAAWWAIAIGAAGAVMELHVLGIVFLVAIGVLALLEIRRERAVLPGIVGGGTIVAVLLLPLLVHELQSDFSEVRLMVDYLLGGDSAPTGGPALALAFTLFRIIGWPLVGLVTDVPVAAGVLVAIVVGLAGIWDILARGAQRTALWWLVGIVAWSTVALAFAAPSLQTVVAGLPNDHYHAFVDPIIVILIAGAAAALWARLPRPAAVVVGAGIAVLLAVEVARWPPATDPDGGWLAARDAGVRIAAATDQGRVVLIGLPEFKLADGIGFPIVRAGATLVPIDAPADAVVVACDRLFEAVIGAPCGGLAEDLVVRDLVPGAADLPYAITRFDASARTTISIYTPR